MSKEQQHSHATALAKQQVGTASKASASCRDYFIFWGLGSLNSFDSVHQLLEVYAARSLLTSTGLSAELPLVANSELTAG